MLPTSTDMAIFFYAGFEDFWCDIVMMIGEKPKLYWKVCWTVVSPVVIFVSYRLIFKNPDLIMDKYLI